MIRTTYKYLALGVRGVVGGFKNSSRGVVGLGRIDRNEEMRCVWWVDEGLFFISLLILSCGGTSYFIPNSL